MLCDVLSMSGDANAQKTGFCLGARLLSRNSREFLSLSAVSKAIPSGNAFVGQLFALASKHVVGRDPTESPRGDS